MPTDADNKVDAMSQTDIDSLVDSFEEQEEVLDATGDSMDEDGEGGNAYEYDFKRPNRISKDQLRTLLSIHDSFSRLYSTSLSSILRSFIEIQIESIDQLTYSEVIMSLPNPTSLFVFDVDPLERKGFLEINLPLVFSIVDRLFGGRGRSIDSSRELTHIEDAVSRRIVDRAFEDLTTAWAPFYDLKPRLHSTESNPRFVQISLQNDIVLFLSFKVIMEESYGLLSLCFPYLLLEPMLTHLSNTSWFVSNLRGQTPGEEALLNRETSNTMLDIKAVVGSTNVAMRDFVQLEPGDVIRLDQPANDPLQVLVGDRLRYKGKAGLIGTRKAVQIDEEMLPDDLDDDTETEPIQTSPDEDA